MRGRLNGIARMETVSPVHNVRFAHYGYMFRLPQRSHHQAVHRIIKGIIYIKSVGQISFLQAYTYTYFIYIISFVSTQPLKMSTRDFSWGKGGRCVRLTTYHPCTAERQDDLGP